MNKTGLYVIVLCLIGGYVLQPLVHPLVVKHLGVTVDDEKLIDLVGKSKQKFEEAKVKVAEQAKQTEGIKEKVAEVTERFQETLAETQGAELEDESEMDGDAQAGSAGESETADSATGEMSVVDAMKASLKQSATSRFSFDDVLEWHEVGEIRIQGVMYREGQILVKMQTVLGENPHRVQAILDGDKVVRWILVSTRESVM